MKILIVASYNRGQFAPFVVEQAEAIRAAGCEVEYFGICGKGVSGYLRCLSELKQVIHTYRPDIIHAHYGLSGLLCCMQRQVPVVTTYHGSDINSSKGCLFSYWAIRFSCWNIFVSRKIYEKAGSPTNSSVIPCAVNTQLFYPQNKTTCRAYFGLNCDRKYVLFSNAFDEPVKNYPLAKAAVDLVREETKQSIDLIELKGYSREEVAMLMNACDCALMTSFNEGSPQFVKEALACGCPVLSTDVGDVADVLLGMEGCYITSYDAADVAAKIKLAFNVTQKQYIEERCKLAAQEFNRGRVTSCIIQIYQHIFFSK